MPFSYTQYLRIASIWFSSIWAVPDFLPSISKMKDQAQIEFVHWKTSNSIWISDFIFVPTSYIQLPQSRDKNEIEENQIEEIRKYWVLFV